MFVNPEHNLQNLSGDALLSRTPSQCNVIIAKSIEYVINKVLSRIKFKQ